MTTLDDISYGWNELEGISDRIQRAHKQISAACNRNDYEAAQMARNELRRLLTEQDAKLRAIGAKD